MSFQLVREVVDNLRKEEEEYFSEHDVLRVAAAVGEEQADLSRFAQKVIEYSIGERLVVPGTLTSAERTADGESRSNRWAPLSVFVPWPGDVGDWLATFSARWEVAAQSRWVKHGSIDPFYGDVVWLRWE